MSGHVLPPEAMIVSHPFPSDRLASQTADTKAPGPFPLAPSEALGGKRAWLLFNERPATGCRKLVHSFGWIPDGCCRVHETARLPAVVGAGPDCGPFGSPGT